MQSRFPAPVRSTRIRFFSSNVALTKAIKARSAWILLDQGVPTPFGFDESRVLRVKGGEACKRWSEVERVLIWLAENKAERSQALVVIGGGAVLDLGALVACLYRRGMPLLMVPSTLLGMVDATLGGKSAVDIEISGRLWKNFAGTFYPAAQIFVCLELLRSLPERERVSGSGEVFKTLWIRGGKWNSSALAAFVREVEVGKDLRGLVRDCLALKAKVVERDPLDEKRIREVLNYGHTVGHALESASSLSHGECVMWGMAVENRLLGPRGKVMAQECARAISELHLAWPKEFRTLSFEEWMIRLESDKKFRGGKIEMSLLERPGRVVRKKFSIEQIAQAIKEFPESFPPEGKHQQER